MPAPGLSRALLFEMPMLSIGRQASVVQVFAVR
jgi:hypothetical protein